MNSKERIRPVLKVIRIIVGCIIALLAGFLAGTCFFCAIAALFGGLELDSFGEQAGYFLLYFVLAAIFFYAMVWGRRIKNGKKPAKQQAKPAVQKRPKTELPQPSEDQRRLEEIDRNIDYTVGAIQANPMSPGKGAYEAELAALQQEKRIRMRRMASLLNSVTVQDAWNTFTPEQQKGFDAQVDQYSQDVGRGGLEHEIAAANRGLVFVDGRPVPKEVAARLKELREAATAEKERKKNMTLQPMDYPVPFTELLIDPNRIVKRSGTAQVLHDEEGASYGDRSKETVYLYEENGRTVLVCEKQRRDEHSPQEDSEWSMKARLSMVPQPCHRIPLTKWALSMPWWANLRESADEIYVRCPSCEPAEYSFHRYRHIKSSSRKNSHDQPGWNCTYDEIGLGFDSPDVWHLCRESHWQEAPSGLTYQVTIQMRLRPGKEKESDETLCALVDSLPWWNPDSADRLMWNARNWLDADWLQKQAEFNNSMHRKHPHNEAYEKALDEVLQQLCLLEESKTGGEGKMKKTITFMTTTGGDLKGYRMDMHTTSGEKYSFILSGLTAFNPNRSSRCGYGCDDWLFHCTLEGEDYILNFSDEASYGRCWRCVPISREDADHLAQMEAADWLRLMANSGKQIYHLHPDHAAKARAAMNITASRCGPISDKDFYGL